LGEPTQETLQMTAETSAGAVSHAPTDWQAIPWLKIHREVRRLQARIVKATQAGKRGKVKALQHLLTHSFSGKALAVRRVTENQGKNTPGVDGATWRTPSAKTRAIRQIRRRGYQPQPLRRVYIPKSNGKRRPLGIPTMQDRAMQALYKLALDPIAETTGDRNSYGFRSERSTADAIAQCFITLATKTSPQWILEGDIKSCFDRISHDWLLANIPMDKVILRKWLKAGYLEKQAFYSTEEGAPQGGVISPVLANLALDGLEPLLRKHFPSQRWNKPKDKVNLVRYADDFIITGTSQALLVKEVKPLVEGFLAERGLELSAEKTRVTHIEAGFDFLGQNVRKYSGGKVLLITPSKKNVKAFLETVKGTVRRHRGAPAAAVIARLNPLIRGWANYHRHVVSKRTFSKVDEAINTALWRWAVNGHRNKGKRWISRQYWKPEETRNWVFTGEYVGEHGETRTLRLLQASQTPIKRHVKIKSEANPYDPEWEVYFEERLGVKMAANRQGRRTLNFLWRQQGGLCPVCQQPITQLTGWHNHHLVMRSHGGGDHVSNRVLLHPTCHRQAHSLGLEVVKPRPATGVGKA
jgi:RNA-directed DNA polymerase